MKLERYLVALLAITLWGCTTLENACVDNPRACDAIVIVGTTCVAVGIGVVTARLHKSTMNPEPKYTPFVAAFQTADQSRKFIDAYRSTLQHKDMIP